MEFPPPIRITVPVLLLLFGLVFIAVDYALLLNSDLGRARESVSDLAEGQAARLAGLMAKNVPNGDHAHLSNELGYLSEDPEVKYAVISDRADGVLHATHSDWQGRLLDTTPASEGQELVDKAIRTRLPQQATIQDHDVLIAAHPFLGVGSGEVQGAVIVARDMSNPLGAARSAAKNDALISAALLFVASILLGFALNYFLGRRVQRIIGSAQVMTENEPPQPPLQGGDEMAVISSAIHQAHLRIVAQSRSIAEQEERYRRMVETLPEMIFVSRNDRIEYINSRGLEMLGAASADQVVGRLVMDFVQGRITQGNGSTVRGSAAEDRLMRLDGTTIDVEIVASSYQDQRGTALQVVATDISERKASEAKREALSRDLKDKNKELEAVVYVASHDLRSPLVNVMGFSQQLSGGCRQLTALMDQAGDGSVSAKDMEPVVKTTIPRALRFIEQGVTKMDALLAGFLRFSRLGNAALEMQPLDMNGMLKSIVGAMTFQIQQSGADVRVGVLPRGVGDSTQINQVFTNLIDNAIKYRHPDRPCVISVQGRTEGGEVIYTVTDNGIGIARPHMEKIFEIFHRLSPNATPGEGLGLTIAQRILKRHNGSINVESQLGEGSTFIISLPLSQITTPEL